MKNFPLLFCLVLLLAFGAFAQSNQTSNCPTLDVTGGGVVESDEPLTFTADIGSSGQSNLTFRWTVTSGEIIEGQGTSTIKVLHKNNGENVTATVEVKDSSSGCILTDSETGSTICPPPPRLFDEYGPLPNGDLKARTQNLFVDIANNPGAQGYFISYGTNREVALREKQIRYVIKSLNLDASRITLVRGGANLRGKGVWTKVWIVPPGAENPTPDM